MTYEQAHKLATTGYVYNHIFGRILPIECVHVTLDHTGHMEYVLTCRDHIRCYDIVDADVVIATLPPDKASSVGIVFEAS